MEDLHVSHEQNFGNFLSCYHFILLFTLISIKKQNKKTNKSNKKKTKHFRTMFHFVNMKKMKSVTMSWWPTG